MTTTGSHGRWMDMHPSTCLGAGESGGRGALGDLFAQRSDRISTLRPYRYGVDRNIRLITLVQDYSPGEFKNNVLALANLAKYFRLPTILTTSFEEGPNGPIMPELKAIFPDAPFIPRPGHINAWDNRDFVAAVERTGRRQLIIAGVVTDVCVAFPALSAIEAGYQVFAVVDASGTFNKDVRDAALMRMTDAGVQPMNWFAVACELHRDWRNDIEGLGALFSNHIPNYQNLMTSYFAKTTVGRR
jgi:nicotinamidase-related amidase